LKRASAWGNRAPSDRFEFAARQVSAVDMSDGIWARALSGELPTIAAPMQAILTACHTLSLMSRQRLEKKPGMRSIDSPRSLFMNIVALGTLSLDARRRFLQ
jgi:hypothetical protein